MKILYDEEHDACAVVFSKDDTVFSYQTDEGLEMHSCEGGKPEWVNTQLRYPWDWDENKI